MRAGRLLRLLLLLQRQGRQTAAALAAELEVSERTVLRDIEALSGSGVPVFAVRGRGGGFELLDTFDRPEPAMPPGLSPTHGRLRRVRVRLSPEALRRALVLGRPDGWRPRPADPPDVDRPGWIVGSFRFDGYGAAIDELLSIGPDVEILLPVELRAAMADVGRRIVALHDPTSSGGCAPGRR